MPFMCRQWLNGKDAKANANMLVRTALKCWYVMLEESAIGVTNNADYLKMGGILAVCRILWRSV